MIGKNKSTDPKKGRCFFKKTIFAAIMVVGVYIISSIIATPFISKAVFRGIAKEQPACEFEGEKTEQIMFLEADNPQATVVLSPGIKDGLDSRIEEAKALNAEGFNVLLYYQDVSKFRSLTDAVGILEEKIEYARERQSDDCPIFLVGYSLGAYASALESAFDSELAGIVAIYGFDDANEFMLKSAASYVGSIPAGLEYPFLYTYNALVNGIRATVSGKEALKGSSIPVLIIGNEKDSTVTPDVSLYQKMIEEGEAREGILLRDNTSDQGHSIEGITETTIWDEIVGFLKKNIDDR